MVLPIHNITHVQTYFIVASPSKSKPPFALGGGVGAVVLLGVGVVVVIVLKRRGVFTHNSVQRGDNHPNISLDPLHCKEESFNKR